MTSSRPPEALSQLRPETGLPALSIVLPCYNEEANIGPMVSTLASCAPAVASDLELVVVDDGSWDNTSHAVEEAKRRLAQDSLSIVVVRHNKNLGYGAALKSGFRAATHPLVFTTDGDDQFDLAQLPAFVSQHTPGSVLVGYRAPRADRSFFRTLNGRGWTWLTNRTLKLGVRDVNCAFKLFPRDFLDAIPMTSRGATIDAELLYEARLRGFQIIELPVRHRARRHGEASGANPRVIGRALLELAQLLRRGRIAPAE